jgi:hypothetical protein
MEDLMLSLLMFIIILLLLSRKIMVFNKKIYDKKMHNIIRFCRLFCCF